jgi:hypothetical protein
MQTADFLRDEKMLASLTQALAAQLLRSTDDESDGNIKPKLIKVWIQIFEF